MELNNIHYYYLRKMNNKDTQAYHGHPCGVVAIRENLDGTVNRGIAYCSSKDKFSKMRGRGLALQRLLIAETRNFIPFKKYKGKNENQNFDRDKHLFLMQGYYHDTKTAEELKMFPKEK